MKTPASWFAVSLAVGAMTLTPGVLRAKDFREEGPREIEKCQTIDKPGSYKLVNNLTASTNADCLVITVNSVTIDLAGFTITGNSTPFQGTGIIATPASGNLVGIAVRNGSISNFSNGVELSLANGSIVERLRVSGAGAASQTGITVNGIVKGNTVIDIAGLGSLNGIGISATGTVTGNYVTGSRVAGIQIGQGSTVIGNTSVKPGFPGGGWHICGLSLQRDRQHGKQPRAEWQRLQQHKQRGALSA